MQKETSQSSKQQTNSENSPKKTSINKDNKKKKKIIIAILLVFLFILAITATIGIVLYQNSQKEDEDIDDSTQPQYATDTKDNSQDIVYKGTTQRFAEYKEPKLDFIPKVRAYNVSSNLQNVTNKDSFNLSKPEQDMLGKNNFVVVEGLADYREFFQIYEENRYQAIPNFITTDSILHNYHLLYDHILKTIEEDKLSPTLKQLGSKMLNESEKIYNSSEDKKVKMAAKRLMAFFATGQKVLDSSSSVPSAVSNEVSKEMKLIENHSENFTLSPVMTIGVKELDITEDYKEDYTQYVPRGHYTKSETLKKYFKSMMYYGRLTFRQKSSNETMSALLITYLLSTNEDIANLWDTIYEPTNFFVGKADDLSCYDYQKVMNAVYGQNPSLADFTNEAKFTSFEKKVKELPSPKINSMPIFDESVNPDRDSEIKGLRFMGQRYTIDASVFQNLIYRSVKENPGGKRRMLPKGLDITAAMGSKESYSILEDIGETEYKKYPENMNKSKQYISSLGDNIWTQNLYWGWLYTIKPLTEEKTKGYPSFMTNKAWVRKDINTYLGSWTELKHDTILYAKQVYAELGSVPPAEKDSRGYVEPRPYVYSRLEALTDMTINGLKNRELASKETLDTLEEMKTLLTQLKDISIKELENKELTDKEYETIEFYGGKLEHFWLETLDDPNAPNPNSQLNDNPAALIADVATDPNGQVLEEGIGQIDEIYVVVPIDGKLRIAKGGVFSYYEFSWPQNDRLTDEKWREMVFSDGGKDKPDRPDWTEKYLIEE